MYDVLWSVVSGHSTVFITTSDRNIIELNAFVNRISKDKNMQQFNYHRANYQDIIEAVISKSWGNIEVDDVNDVWGIIKSDILQIRDSFVPLTGKSNLKAKWVNKTVTKCRRGKRDAWDNYVASGKIEELYEVYKKKLYKSTSANEDAKSSLNLS